MTTRRHTAGATLLELLVVLGLFALLAAAVAPVLIGQIGNGRAHRVASDLSQIGSAAQRFRLEVGRWPGEAEHLWEMIDGSQLDLFGASYGAGRAARWDGPYMDQAGSDVALDTVRWSGEMYLGVRLSGTSRDQGRRVAVIYEDEEIDFASADTARSRFRWTSTEGGTLTFLATRIADVAFVEPVPGDSVP